MKRKKWFIPIISIITFLFLSIIAFGLFIINKNIEPFTDLTHLSGDISKFEPRVVDIDGVKIYKQPDKTTCGIATISTIASYSRGEELPPEKLIGKYDLQENGGMDYEQFLKYLSLELPEYEIEYINGLDDFELIKTIHEQLERNIPLPVFFGSLNPYNEPFYNFHASVVTGIDLEKKQINIANVYGYEEQIHLVEFLNRMSYRETEKYPFIQRIIIKMGLIDTNSVFLIEKK
jgi:hypothetical protein